MSEEDKILLELKEMGVINWSNYIQDDTETFCIQNTKTEFETLAT